MTEKELQKNVVGGNILSNILITLKIVLDLTPQLLLVYLISSLIEQNIAVEKVKYFSCNAHFLYSKRSMLLFIYKDCPRKSL